MGIIERIYIYLKAKGITAYEFERKCELSNGYLNSRKTGTRGIGSEILEKIYRNYTDLNLIWLITGEGQMINDSQAQLQAQLQAQPEKHGIATEGKKDTKILIDTNVIEALYRDQIDALKSSNIDKDKIIAMLEEKLKYNKTTGK